VGAGDRGVTLHAPVLLEEAIGQLCIQPNGVYVDGTFGRGGHSQVILSQLGTGGRLFAMDRDPDAVKAADLLAQRDRRLVVEHGSFESLGKFLKQQGVSGDVDGILLDLGISSPQLADPDRGFSFQVDGPLDMRMDPERGESAASWINSAAEKSISTVLFRYGEENSARKIARAICERRTVQSIETTLELAQLIESVVPRRPGRKHPATKSFQAIRIYINRELEALEKVLPQALDGLCIGGRLCVISFHSLEDRVVKRFLRGHSRVDPALAQLPVVPESAQPRMRLPVRAIRSGELELSRNPRARSATLRVGECIA
jgi:16S rRNA (cytosine1402-N4)-methyltransferase